MSGIVGILNVDGAPVDPHLLRNMTDMLAYRGPDAQEFWIDGCVGMGHTLLRTTFESHHEKQPYTLDGQVWITADARIDDRAELIRNLKAQGRTIAAEATDAELILHAYHAWGDGCIHHLLGDFAFAIWDGKRRRLFCARDHFGVKLFYYAGSARSFLFSNTLNCLRKHPDVTDQLNELAIGDFLLFGYNPETSTTSFADIRRLSPGHVLELSEGGVRISQYWSLPTENRIIRYPHASDYVHHFKEILSYAVKDRLRTEHVSIFMSGGLDSPTLAATACELHEKESVPLNLRAYCCVYDESPDEERYYAGLVAKTLGIPIEYSIVDRYRLFERWDQRELWRPEPFDAPLMAIEHDLLKMAMTHSRLVLYGEDGDALLSSPSLLDMFKGMESAEVIADLARHLASRRTRPPFGLGIMARLKRLMEGWRKDPVYPAWLNEDFAARWNLSARWNHQMKTGPEKIHSLRSNAHRRLNSSYWQSLFESHDPGVTFMPVEYRLPLLDLRLVNYVLAIPPLPWCVNKELLRATMRGALPESVRLRRKSPLAFDPYKIRLQQSEVRWLDDFKPTPELARYVKRDAIPRFTGSDYNTDASPSVHLRPWVLNHWLQSLQS